MKNTRKGGTYLETLISLFILLIILNPLFSSLIYLKKGFNRINEFNELENEMEKIRGYYRSLKTIDNYSPLNKNYKIQINKKQVFEDLYSIEIKIEKNTLKRESKLYVYKQK